MANCITCIRILCGVLLLIAPLTSPLFCTLYALAGLSDMIDGPVARRTNTASSAGARLDSAADFVLFLACFVRFAPLLSLPGWLWGWVAAIGAIRCAAAMRRLWRKSTPPHTILDRATGLSLFLLTPLLPWVDAPLLAIPLCALATCAALYDRRITKKE